MPTWATFISWYIPYMYIYMVYILYHCHPQLPPPNDYTKNVYFMKVVIILSKKKAEKNEKYWEPFLCVDSF